MGERRYRISFDLDEESLKKILGLHWSWGYDENIQQALEKPEKFRAAIANAYKHQGRAINRLCESVEIVQDEAPKQSGGAGQSCGQTDDGQVLNQLGDASKCPHCYSNNTEVISSGVTGHTYTDCGDCGAFCLKEKTLPKPCPICSKCNTKEEAKSTCQSDEKEHPENFCMFCGGELIHTDNSLWDGVWVHSVCIPY